MVLLALALAAFASGAKPFLDGGSTLEVSAVVKRHEPVTKQVTVGGRSATRKDVQMTRVTLGYELDGVERVLEIDRAPALAQEQLPVGASLSLFVDPKRPGQAALERNDPRTLSLSLLLAGVLLAASALGIFIVGRQA